MHHELGRTSGLKKKKKFQRSINSRFTLQLFVVLYFYKGLQLWTNDPGKKEREEKHC